MSIVLAICLAFGFTLDQVTEPEPHYDMKISICNQHDTECKRGWKHE